MLEINDIERIGIERILFPKSVSYSEATDQKRMSPAGHHLETIAAEAS